MLQLQLLHQLLRQRRQVVVPAGHQEEVRALAAMAVQEGVEVSSHLLARGGEVAVVVVAHWAAQMVGVVVVDCTAAEAPEAAGKRERAVEEEGVASSHLMG